MGLLREQASKYDRQLVGGNWKFYKNQTARWNRRQAKRLLDDAPKKNRYKGWAA